MLVTDGQGKEDISRKITVYKTCTAQPGRPGLRDSFLLAVFIYWGWDCALSVNEETKDSARTPGRAAVMSTIMPTARAVLAMSAHGAIGKWFARDAPAVPPACGSSGGPCSAACGTWSSRESCRWRAG